MMFLLKRRYIVGYNALYRMYTFHWKVLELPMLSIS